MIFLIRGVGNALLNSLRNFTHDKDVVKWVQVSFMFTLLEQPRRYRFRLRLRLRQCSFNQNRYIYHIRFTKNTPIYNNHVFLMYNESNAHWETSIKVISYPWHGGHPKRKSMHTQWNNTQCNFLMTECVLRRPPWGPPLRHPYYRRDSRTHLRAGHSQVKSTDARSPEDRYSSNGRWGTHDIG